MTKDGRIGKGVKPFAVQKVGLETNKHEFLIIL